MSWIVSMPEAKFQRLTNHFQVERFEEVDADTDKLTGSHESKMADAKTGSSNIANCIYARNKVPRANSPFQVAELQDGGSQNQKQRHRRR